MPRRRSNTSRPVLAALALLALPGVHAVAAPPTLSPSNVALHMRGRDLVDAEGNVVVLRAINLGNWLLIEPWMYAQNTGAIPDQATFMSVLASRFGQADAAALMDLHRAGWVTQRDFDLVASAGFNCVRIPVSHSLLESEPFVVREAGFDLLASALRMAENAGLYVILDMHSTPGGQSTDQPSGDVTQNSLWTDPVAQERLAWLWQHVARRLKNTPNFVAYDLINEPYSDYVTDVRDEIVPIVDRAVRAIREVDPDRLILAPATLEGLRFYGDPAARGWTNTGFTEHFYPGVFDGNPATLGTQARFAASTLRDRADLAASYAVPFLWGEFNPVFDRAGAPQTVRDLLDDAEGLGVNAAVWTLKLVTSGGGVSSNNWYLATNATPLGLGDIRTSPRSTIQAVFSTLGQMPLAIDQAYFDALTAPEPQRVLPRVDLPPLTPPGTDAWSNWNVTDIGSVARAGGQSVGANAGPLGAEDLTLYAAGLDLFGTSDSLRLASRQMPSQFVVSAVFDAFEGGRYAQAGVTVRASEAANAPHVSLVLTPDGRVSVKSRGVAGASTAQRYVATTGFPVGMAIGRDASGFVAWLTDEDGLWRSIPLSESPAVGSAPRGGIFACANREGPLSVFRTHGPLISSPPTLTSAPTLDTGTNLLANPSFEGGSGQSPASWTAFGEKITREVGWTPVREGSALLAYRHWEATTTQSSGAYQVVTGLTPGEPYTLTVYANRDTVQPGRALADRVELRVENTTGDAWLESTEFGVSEIATGSRWSRLQVRFVATNTEHRVRIVAYPGSGTRDGAVKFDGLYLVHGPQ